MRRRRWLQWVGTASSSCREAVAGAAPTSSQEPYGRSNLVPPAFKRLSVCPWPPWLRMRSIRATARLAAGSTLLGGPDLLAKMPPSWRRTHKRSASARRRTICASPTPRPAIRLDLRHRVARWLLRRWQAGCRRVQRADRFLPYYSTRRRAAILRGRTEIPCPGSRLVPVLRKASRRTMMTSCRRRSPTMKDLAKSINRSWRAA
jgi:hypothetical protein